MSLLGSAAGKLLGKSAAFAARETFNARNVSLAGRAGLTLGATALSFGAAAGALAIGAGYAANRAAHTIGGGKVFSHKEHEFLGWKPAAPALSPGMQRGIIAGTLGAGAAQGMAGSRWNVQQAISTGALEVERPMFLGATGSLTISSYSRSRRRAAPPAPGLDYGRMAATYGDDVLRVAHTMFA